jgi:coenzyme F420 hydrogenase subunit beta
MSKITNLRDVVERGLCTGCGACYYACSEGGITLVNIEGVGIRPRFDSDASANCTKCLSICPGNSVDGNLASGPPKAPESIHDFGQALEIWEGYAADPEIRHRGSSGGVTSALTLYCLEQEDMSFALHSAMDDQQPWINNTVQSRTRTEILSRAGSRYAPASPCAGLEAIEKSDRPCVFIGKPCDTAAVWMLRRERPELDRNLGLVLSFFCAGTPSTKGTLDLVDALDVDRKSVDQIRYRGEGWPGNFKILYNNGSREKSLSYEDSWGQLSHYRPLRCQLCPDGLGRVADVSCGDAWESFNKNGDPGRSIVIVRTERGREIVRRAIAANYVQLTPATSKNVLDAQQNLLQKRKDLFGRLLGLRLFLAPVPNFEGFSLTRAWMQLPLSRKANTILSTVKRILLRRLWQRKPLFSR